MPGVDFRDEAEFFGTITKRIYTLRCAIVHANPEFEEPRGHLLASSKNKELVITEAKMLRTIAIQVIYAASAEFDQYLDE